VTEAPGARRRRIDGTTQEKDAGRSGCLWLGGVLGVVAGVLFAFFAMPPLLDVLFPPEHVAVGETFDHEGRVVTVRELRAIDVTLVDPAGAQRWRVIVELTAERSWTLEFDTFQLRLDSGDEVKTAAFETKDLTPEGSNDGLRLPLGEPALITLQFIAPDDSPPAKLILDEPQVEFDLPPPSQP
jgi:hypothetical protein